MLQHKEPGDFVVATGESHSVREFCEEAFGYAGLDWEQYVEIDPQYFRPTEVDYLMGDYAKGREVLGWKPKATFSELVRSWWKPTFAWRPKSAFFENIRWRSHLSVDCLEQTAVQIS